MEQMKKEPHAVRPFFCPADDDAKQVLYIEENCTFPFFSGFSLERKQQSVRSMHQVISQIRPGARILEVSRRSEKKIGEDLSAFNLHYYTLDGKWIPVENIFQSSKVFDKGGPYLDLLTVSPKDAKTDIRIKDPSAKLVSFRFAGDDWPLVPVSFFYDYIYLTALWQNPNLGNALLEFDAFTDIEFNPKKSLNCQARSVAIFVALTRRGLLQKYIKNPYEFISVIYPQTLAAPKSTFGQQTIFG